MIFKDSKLEAEFFKITPKLRLLLCEADYFLWKKKQPAVVTCLLRSSEEQMALYEAGQASSKVSVHMYGRGADLRMVDWIEECAEYLNQKYPYDLKRPKMVSALIHGGTGKHLHLQTKE